VIGKNTGDDFRERKLTLPVIRAVARADASERAFWVRTIEKGDQRDGDLEQAMELLRRHGTLEETRIEANAHADAAREALGEVPEHPLTEMMADLAGYVVARLN
jgi:octaprenyl-diphosphate synthase